MIRIRDIALQLGISTCTVSNALRGHGRMAPETRDKILAAAEALGYRPNAAATVMASQKHQKRQELQQLRIGWLGHDIDHASYSGFMAGCKEYGYEGKWVRPTLFQTPKQMVRILWNRGYSGLVISILDDHWTKKQWLDADWNLLSLVKQWRGLEWLSFPLIRHSAFEYMLFTLKEAWKRGYRRYVVLLHPTPSQIDNQARLGSLMAFAAEVRHAGGSVFWRETDSFSHPDLRKARLDAETIHWIKDCAPDAIIGFPFAWIYLLRHAGFNIPGEIGFASVLSSAYLAEEEHVCGCDPQFEACGIRAVSLLHTLIQSNKRGIFQSQLQDVVTPIWVDCGTLPDRN